MNNEFEKNNLNNSEETENENKVYAEVQNDTPEEVTASENTAEEVPVEVKADVNAETDAKTPVEVAAEADATEEHVENAAVTPDTIYVGANVDTYENKDVYEAHEQEKTEQSEPVNAEPNYAAYAGGQSYTSGNANGYEWNGAQGETVEKKKKKRKSDGGKGLRVFTGVLLSVFVLSFVSLTAMVASLVFDDDFNRANVTPAETAESSQQDYNPGANAQDYAAMTPHFPFQSTGGLTIPQIAAKCQPSAVGILVEVSTSYNFGFFSQSGTATSVGSGFIFSEDGYIITNHHVIEGAKKITVVLNDKTELEAELVGSDTISDIAVIKVKDTKGTKLTPMEIGNSDDLVVGEPVVAIGCPAGIEYLGTVTDGIISAINRDVEITDAYGRIQKTMTLIQTNATINKGNSGGPLINSRGQVIGINTLKLTSEFEGIGFSIPMNGAMAIINQLIEHGEVIERTEEDFAYGSGQIGIQGQAITAEEAEHYGIPEGVLVYQIDKTSSAAKAGLRRGDIITKYNGKDVKTVQDINDLKAKNRAGETVTVTVYRDSDDGKGATLDISFKLDAAS